jgi:anti-anti-sigma regulatory factor
VTIHGCARVPAGHLLAMKPPETTGAAVPVAPPTAEDPDRTVDGGPAPTADPVDSGRPDLVTGIAIGILVERYRIAPARAAVELDTLIHRHGLPAEQVIDMLTGSRGESRAEAGPASPPLREATPGYISADRDARGPVLVFTGEVTKDTVSRYRLLERPASWPPHVDLRAATLLSAAALNLLRHMAERQRRLGNRLHVTVTDSVVRHQLLATGLNTLARISTD